MAMSTNPPGSYEQHQPMMGGAGQGGYTTSTGYGDQASPGGYAAGPAAAYGQQPGGYGGGYTGGPMPGQDPSMGGFAAPGAPGMAGMAGGNEGLASIEKNVKWRLLFFAGACCTLAAGSIATLYFMLNFFHASSWSPCTFISALFLTGFGFLMMVLDAPLPHPNKHLIMVRDAIYRFGLFMTRFTGRGAWYIFLGTHAWVALYDDQIATWLAVLLTTYLVLLGIAALVKGYMLSDKLQGVRRSLMESHRGVESYMNASTGYMTKEQFHHMVTAVTNQPDLFNEDELNYVLNALSFRPDPAERLKMEELDYWVQPGGWSWV
eukprot:TRINITY_DN63430_c0_g1_i1.p1 TRINITY_DN63430_c0_g1~~TRINITY_DN63430_c0_g1_i1.p1  ORF type:complete len:320 (+),score=61.88 TRINITY_DN63430_c0_g1_i1:67-1026(+)